MTGKETEENWVLREQALQRIRCLIRGNAISFDRFNHHIKSLGEVAAATVRLKIQT